MARSFVCRLSTRLPARIEIDDLETQADSSGGSSDPWPGRIGELNGRDPVSERLFGADAVAQRLQVTHLSEIGQPLARVKKLTDLTCTRTVLPSLCTFSGDAGLVAVQARTKPGCAAPNEMLRTPRSRSRRSRN